MARTDISICALALMKLGAAPINSFSTPGDMPKLLKAVYPELKETIAAAYPWECLKIRRELTREVGSPGGYRYAFIMPPEMLGAPGAVYPSNEPYALPTSNFEVRQRRILSNDERLWSDFSTLNDEDQWPAWFADLVTSALCAEIAFAVTDQQSVQDDWHTRTYGTPSEGGQGGKMGLCQTLDAQGSGNNPGLSDSAFVDARFGGAY